MPLRYTSRILDHLAHATYRPASVKTLARDLRVDRDDRDVFDAAVAALVEEGRIEIGPDERVRLPAMGDEITGRFRLNERGFGFVIPDDPRREGDLFVPRGSVRDAISGDRVRARVQRQAWRGKSKPGRSDVVGRIVEVLERGQEHFVGTLVKRGRQWFVEPDGRSLYDPVVIRDPHAKNAKAGDKVVIELLHYPDEDYHAEGVITSVLGEAGRPDVETQAVIAAHGLRTEFPPAVLGDAKTVQAKWSEADEDAGVVREDLTGQLIFTIDPPDAKDFDDAISIDLDDSSGEWTLGVHIADVATFVTPGSALDEEARARGNSVYLPRLVIPMLPEVLSNGVCSLQEGVIRLTKSVFITFDRRGKVIGQRVAATRIRSRKRLTYLEAQALIDGDPKEARKHARSEPEYPADLVERLQMADRLARVLRKRRQRDGMIVLDLPDIELVFDDDGHVVDAVPEDDAFTHTIIEMFMVEANEALARQFDSLLVPILRRIHPDPKFGAMEELRMFVQAAGLSVPEEPTRQDMQALLDATRGTPMARSIHFAVLRTLSKASYSPAVIGHFALASDHYAHFTSPIRRYPDLTLHRALEAYLDATDNGRKAPGGRQREALGRRLRDDGRVPDEGELITLGRHCSDTELEAEAAERELREFLVMQFLQENHLGDDFAGVVSGVMSKGLFVSLERFLVEGLVPLSELPGAEERAGQWRVDATSRRATGRGGASIGLGDHVTVRLVSVDLASRRLELALTELPCRPEKGVAVAAGAAKRSRPATGGKSKGHRRGYKKGRRGRRG
jgi:ribonuclease R